MKYIILLVAALSNVATSAAGSDRWKLIAGDGSVATSDCIDTYETVDCLADSIAACDAWTEWPPSTPDGVYRPAAICDRIPGYVDGGPFYSPAPKDTTVHLYKTDQWTLQSAEEWGVKERSHAIARPGDTVLSFDSIVCQPDPQCLRQIDISAPASEILASCPRVYCRDSFLVQEGEDSAGNKFLYDYPVITFLIRQIDQKWNVIDSYSASSDGSLDQPWISDHWKR